MVEDTDGKRYTGSVLSERAEYRGEKKYTIRHDMGPTNKGRIKHKHWYFFLKHLENTLIYLGCIFTWLRKALYSSMCGNQIFSHLCVLTQFGIVSSETLLGLLLFIKFLMGIVFHSTIWLDWVDFKYFIFLNWQRVTFLFYDSISNILKFVLCKFKFT